MSCVLCNKFFVVDGCNFCNQCLSSTSDIEDLDIFVTKALNLFTKSSMMEIASSQLLKSIYSGQLYSYRHNWFKAGGEDKRCLRNADLLSLLSEDQSNELFKALVLAFNSLKDSDYVFKVLVPESIVFLFAKFSNVSRIKAEVALNAYISEKNNKLFCSSLKSTSEIDIDFSIFVSESQSKNKIIEEIGKSKNLPSINAEFLNKEWTKITAYSPDYLSNTIIEDNGNSKNLPSINAEFLNKEWTKITADSPDYLSNTIIEDNGNSKNLPSINAEFLNKEWTKITADSPDYLSNTIIEDNGNSKNLQSIDAKFLDKEWTKITADSPECSSNI
nr:uncharacterized protein LOC124812131 isoform X2 [Hydra vulgaris]